MKLKIVTWIAPTIEHLWEIRKSILEDENSNRAHPGDFFGFFFGYPNYAGLPESIHSKIPSEIITIINKETWWVLQRAKTKNSFATEMLKLLTNESVVCQTEIPKKSHL